MGQEKLKMGRIKLSYETYFSTDIFNVLSNKLNPIPTLEFVSAQGSL